MAINASRDWNTASVSVAYSAVKPFVQATNDQTEAQFGRTNAPLSLNPTKEWLEWYIPLFSGINIVRQLTSDQAEAQLGRLTAPLSLNSSKEWLEWFNTQYSGTRPIATNVVTGGSELAASVTPVQIWKTGV
jgi:hypothetical protein